MRCAKPLEFCGTGTRGQPGIVWQDQVGYTPGIGISLGTCIVSAWVTSLVVFACISGGVLLGILLRNTLPGHHLNSDTRDVVRLCTGLIGTIAALVLSLLIASAKNSFDTHSNQVQQLTANVIMLDELLAQYGPEAGAARILMQPAIVKLTDRIWRQDASDLDKGSPFEASSESKALLKKIQDLAPGNDAQRNIKNQATQVTTELAKTRFLLFADAKNSIPMPFLVVLVFWLTIVFASFSLFAEPNAFVASFLFIFALSAAGAIFLILDLGQPFVGLIQISSEPLRNAVAPGGP
jgi:hypothetical protein